MMASLFKRPKLTSKLKELRPSVEEAREKLLCFKFEIERKHVTDEDKKATGDAVSDSITKLVEILTGKGKDFNMMAQEREALRQTKEELAVLKGAINDYEISEGISETERLLVARLSATLENLRDFLRWLDRKTEKTWWMADALKITRSCLYLAIFVCASIACVYPKGAAPLTLTFILLVGILNVVEKVLIKDAKEGPAIQAAKAANPT